MSVIIFRIAVVFKEAEEHTVLQKIGPEPQQKRFPISPSTILKGRATFTIFSEPHQKEI